MFIQSFCIVFLQTFILCFYPHKVVVYFKTKDLLPNSNGERNLLETYSKGNKKQEKRKF